MAPIIVSTNRERYTLTAIRCQKYAKLQGMVAIRWKARFGECEQKPKSHRDIEEAMEDTAFYEWFVPGIDGYCTDNLTKCGKLINATKVKYHSITLSKLDEDALKAQLLNATPGDVITLESPPLSINVSLPDEEKSEDRLMAWSDITLVDDEVVLPIVPRHRGNPSSKYLQQPSLVEICTSHPELKSNITFL